MTPDAIKLIADMKAAGSDAAAAKIAEQTFASKGFRLPNLIEIVKGYASVLTDLVGKEAAFQITLLAAKETARFVEENTAKDATPPSTEPGLEASIG